MKSWWKDVLCHVKSDSGMPASFRMQMTKMDLPILHPSFLPFSFNYTLYGNIHSHNDSAPRETDDSPTIYPSSTEDVGVDSLIEQTKRFLGFAAFTFQWKYLKFKFRKLERKNPEIFDLSLIHITLFDNNTILSCIAWPIIHTYILV